MALSLDQIRTYVRTHLDIEVEDLPDAVLDTFIREGSKRIERAEARWPFYEAYFTWSPAVTATGLYLKSDISPTLDQVAAIVNGIHGPLQWIGPDAMMVLQQSSPQATGRPRFYSAWADNLQFHPNLDVVYTFTVRGYRRSEDWVAAGAGAVPDLPDELHNTVAMWALARAYAQQEDPELASVYERMFSDELNEFRRRLVITPHEQPLVLNGGALGNTPHTILARPRFDWELT